MPPQLLSNRDSSVAPIANRSASDFIKKWRTGSRASQLGERAGAQTHFLELCEVLGVEAPTDADNYCFEKGVKGLSRTVRFADVWRRDCFAWEYKRPGRSLSDALEQLMRYALPLDNPPLLIVSDRQRIEIHTHFTGYPSRCVGISHEELADRAILAKLRDAFDNPYSFRPEHDSKRVTEAAATAFASIADVLRQEGVAPQTAAHFLSQCVFCYFAEDIGLLSAFKRVVLKRSTGDALKKSLTELFRKMQKGGTFGADDIAWFNGGLFNNIDVPVMPAKAVATLAEVANMDWSAIDPSIFGTLFERGLDPQKRTQLGAYYTDPSIISRIVTPLVERALMTEWDECKARINVLLSERDVLRVQAKGIQSTSERLRARRARIRTQANKLDRQANDVFSSFLERLRNFRVLDPACGSGNFLYLSLKALKDIEKQVNLDAETLGLEAQLPVTGPQNVLGLELNEYAAELARMTVWIGELQWRKQNGYGWKLNPILDSLEHIECRDALLDADGNPARWPTADVIVGNPPFIGNKKMRGELGEKYVEAVRRAYRSYKLDGADLVCFWFEKARGMLEVGELHSAGLVSTNSIRGGANREVLNRILETSRIFLAWSDEEWWDNGVAVRVSMTAFGQSALKAELNGVEVAVIHADLTAGIDVTKAAKMPENLSKSFQGVTPSASVNKKLREKLGLPEATFNLGGEVARRLMKEPATINREVMSEVVRPYLIADDITTRPLDRFIVNFVGRDEQAAATFEKPFEAISNVRLHRRHTDRFNDFKKYPWWQFAWPRPDMFSALKGLSRYISITRVSKHHLCAWTPSTVTPGDALVVVARDDDTSIGVLQSRIHEVWALRSGSALVDRPRYTHTTCFETFPFPKGLTPNVPACEYRNDANAQAIAAAARKLIKLRDHYLNPPEWAEWLITARTLTNLYNVRPTWLSMAHETLDMAVAAAYGWNDYTPEMADEEVLRRLLALNAVAGRASGSEQLRKIEKQP
jgi:methylase of polypeptide subunit release factors